MDKTEQELQSSKTERLMEENSRLLQENNQILKTIQRERRMFFWGRILWFIIVLGVMAGVYVYYLKPMLDPFQEYYEEAGTYYEDFSMEEFMQRMQETFEQR